MPEYRDPRDEKMENGRAVADCIRRGPGGLRGVIVSPATAGGIPENFNPHDTMGIKINIVNPDGEKAQSIALAEFTPQAVTQALAAAKQQVQGNDIKSIRERTAVAFEELAKISASNVSRVPIKTAKQQKPRPQEDFEEQVISELETEVSQPIYSVPVEQIDRNYSPMAAFGLKTTPAPKLQTSHSSPVTGKVVPAPQKLVYFEKEGLGTVPAFYHDIIVSVTRDDPSVPEYSGFIVLIYDLRFEQNAARWFPPANDPYQRPWAVQIKNDQHLYLVRTTGFQYVYDSREYCILNVDKALLAVSEEN